MRGRFLIVNADDFGQTHGINRGVMRSHADGIVTSASLMVRWPAAEEAAAYARSHDDLSVGLHVDFGEWAYEGGDWVSLYDVVDPEDRRASERELERQLTRFRGLVGADPTHLDSHQHVHRHEPLRSLLADMGRLLDVPVRGQSPRITYSGAFYGMTGKGDSFLDAITEQSLIALIKNLPPGTTELGCHPGEDDGTELVYRLERESELSVLCAPAVRRALCDAGVVLTNFRERPR